MKKWEEVRTLDVKEIKNLAIESIANSYQDVPKDFAKEFKYIIDNLEKATKYKRSEGFFIKYLYFLASDIEYIKIVNPDTWFMTCTEIDNLDKSELIAQYNKYKDDEDFKDHFKNLEDYIDESMDWSYENNIETKIKALGVEIERFYRR